MDTITGPARYIFLRRARGTREEIPNWPPEIKPLQAPENVVALGVFLTPEEHGWRALPVATDAALQGDAGGAFVLTRMTTFGVVEEGRRAGFSMALLGVRVMKDGDKGAEYATHLVVRPLIGSGVKRPLVAPISAMVLGEYREIGDRAVAELELRLSPAQLAALPPYLPDATIERVASRTLDRVILSPRARHELKPEVIAGRVSLYGKSEMTSFGDRAKAELATAPGVVEIADYLVYSESLQEQVERTLAAKGLGYIGVLSEHGLIMLSGEVPDNATLYRAKDLALRIPGVRGVVVNGLEVRAPADDATTPVAPTSASR